MYIIHSFIIYFLVCRKFPTKEFGNTYTGNLMENVADTVYVKKGAIVGVYFDTDDHLPVIGSGNNNGICVVAGSLATTEVNCSLSLENLIIRAEAIIGKFSSTILFILSVRLGWFYSK